MSCDEAVVACRFDWSGAASVELCIYFEADCEGATRMTDLSKA